MKNKKKLVISSRLEHISAYLVKLAKEKADGKNKKLDDSYKYWK
jgi:hypothetical protein|tara:strand:+ start:2349 stop:2480 length:132 start_codon:yes stop_codon:yes gene_type:complete